MGREQPMSDQKSRKELQGRREQTLADVQREVDGLRNDVVKKNDHVLKLALNQNQLIKDILERERVRDLMVQKFKNDLAKLDKILKEHEERIIVLEQILVNRTTEAPSGN